MFYSWPCIPSKLVPNTMPYMQQVFNKYLWVNGLLNVFRHKIRATSRYAAVAAAKSLQSCLTPCDPTDSSPLGSSVPGILQARILEWVISFSKACMHAKPLQSCPTLCDPMDSSPPGSPVHRTLQARILECAAISFSRYLIKTN